MVRLLTAVYSRYMVPDLWSRREHKRFVTVLPFDIMHFISIIVS